jgi:hypothetical protein
MYPSSSLYPIGPKYPSGQHLEVEDQRFNSNEIERLYEADDYPLRKSGE